MSATTPLDKLPGELPEKPDGWTKHMLVHMNFGSAGGAATYEIKDPQGNAVPFAYQYDTRKNGLTGFSLKGIEGVLTWKQLREAWPAWLAERRAKA